MINDDYVYKGCDIISVNIADDPNFTGSTDTNFSDFKWSIPAGSYTEDYNYEHPAIITVELINGTGKINVDSCIVEYLNGVKNQHNTGGTPVIALVTKSTGQAKNFFSTGELIVNEKPTVLRLRLLQTNRTLIETASITSMVLVLKYSYYVKKPSRIEPAPSNRFS
jgi:hypothetical protein